MKRRNFLASVFAGAAGALGLRHRRAEMIPPQTSYHGKGFGVLAPYETITYEEDEEGKKAVEEIRALRVSWGMDSKGHA